MRTKPMSLEGEYLRFGREARRRRDSFRERGEQAEADAVERRLLRAEIAAHDGSAYCPACGTALSVDALQAGFGCLACAEHPLHEAASTRARKRGIRRRLIDFFFL